MRARTDRNNNPAAFTTGIAKQAGLRLGMDYVAGDPFKVGEVTYHTARLLGDPVKLTLEVIDAIGFYAKSGAPRWTYIAMPGFVWDYLDAPARKMVVQFMYRREGGTEMRGLFK